MAIHAVNNTLVLVVTNAGDELDDAWAIALVLAAALGAVYFFRRDDARRGLPWTRWSRPSPAASP
jgi:hypothetical protein